MKTVKEVSQLTGVSVRTLHHYDAIGLLRPTRVTEAGYRLYDDDSLARLQSVLLLRELQFPLKEIRDILDTPGFDPLAALDDQIRLLEMKRDHLNSLIAHARQIQKSGGISMNFKPYDTKKLDTYAAQAKERWGNTDAWRESQEKARGRTAQDQQSLAEAMMDIFRRIGQLRTGDPAAPEAQALVAELRQFICDHYYNCTPQIFVGLAQMYAAGGEMTENIDRAGGEGTGDFARRAIEIFCR